ncbi:Hypothetical protein A7982_10039 [Minicystis rosea]|nr:Hypothetical protein A7982_10039 [Minicystis rosea]
MKAAPLVGAALFGCGPSTTAPPSTVARAEAHASAAGEPSAATAQPIAGSAKPHTDAAAVKATAPRVLDLRPFHIPLVTVHPGFLSVRPDTAVETGRDGRERSLRMLRIADEAEGVENMQCFFPATGEAEGCKDLAGYDAAAPGIATMLERHVRPDGYVVVMRSMHGRVSVSCCVGSMSCQGGGDHPRVTKPLVDFCMGVRSP